MLTKSLYTVTAVVRVAMYLRSTEAKDGTALHLTRCALDVLGHVGAAYDDETDTTVQACVKAVAKAMQS